MKLLRTMQQRHVRDRARAAARFAFDLFLIVLWIACAIFATPHLVDRVDSVTSGNYERKSRDDN